MSSTSDSLSGTFARQSQQFTPSTGESYVNLPLLSLGTRNIAIAEAIEAQTVSESPTVSITEVIS